MYAAGKAMIDAASAMRMRFSATDKSRIPVIELLGFAGINSINGMTANFENPPKNAMAKTGISKIFINETAVCTNFLLVL
ncbi:hypothetical protein D3C81_1994250 [compost metagenome]